MKFGDIYTNEINHWMVVSPAKEGCSQCGSIGFDPTLIPVVFEDGEPKYTVGFPETKSIQSIKPFARYVGTLTLKEHPPT